MENKYWSFADDLYQLCKENENKTMILYTGNSDKKSYSYKEVYHLVKRYIALFYQKGIEGGDTVVSIMPNSPEAILCFFAAAISRIHYAPLPCTISNRELTNWINLVKPKMIVKKEGIADYDVSIPLCNCKCDGDLSWLPEERENDNRDGSSNVYLLTSGTTGQPKAMSINIDKLWSSGKAFVKHYNLENSDCRFWNYLPMSYLGGLYNLALIPLCTKGSFVISEPFSGKTILNFWNFVKSNEITGIWMVPSIAQGLLKIAKLIGGKNANQFRDQIKIAFLGTAPIQLKVKEEFEETFGIRLYENFALSESTFLTGEHEEDIRFREQGSVGRVLPYISLKLVPMNEIKDINSIWIKTPYLFNGYLTADGDLELELDSEGYFNTKDLGYFNDDGVLVLSGRDRDIIKKGGLFVSLTEIENIIGQLPFIEQVSAVPIKHDFYGETYVLCVIFRNKTNLENEKEKLHLWMLDNFVSYKIPEMIQIFDEFPKTASGKVQKKKLLEQIEEKK